MEYFCFQIVYYSSFTIDWHRIWLLLFYYSSEGMRASISKYHSRHNPDLQTERLPDPKLRGIASAHKRSFRMKNSHLHLLFWEREQQSCMRECCRIKEEIRASLCQDNLMRRKKMESRSTAHYKSTENNPEEKESRGSKDKCQGHTVLNYQLPLGQKKKKRKVCLLPRLKQFESSEIRDEDDNETKHKIAPRGIQRRLMTEGCYDHFPRTPVQRVDAYPGEGSIEMDESKLGKMMTKREKSEKEEDEKTSVTRPYYKYIQNYPGLKSQSKPSPSARHRLMSESQQPRSLRESLHSGSKKDLTTLFHHNKLKLTSPKANKSRVVFRAAEHTLPQNQEQMSEFLIKYKSLSSKFDLKAMVKADNFIVIKNEGEVYFGQIKMNKREGLGILITEKQLFQGRFENNEKVYGSEQTKAGVYKGEYKDDKRNGRGEFFWVNGETFEGEWRAGKKDGYGVWKSPKGDYYEGEWKNSKQNGKGLFLHVGGSTYRGYFKDFLKEGRGEENFQNGDSYSGQYKGGKPHGYGKYLWKNGDRYEGDFVNGSREGMGVLTTAEGIVYQGSFSNDLKHGRGKQKYPSGQSFEGQFFQGERKASKAEAKNDDHLSNEFGAFPL